MSFHLIFTFKQWHTWVIAILKTTSAGTSPPGEPGLIRACLDISESTTVDEDSHTWRSCSRRRLIAVEFVDPSGSAFGAPAYRRMANVRFGSTTKTKAISYGFGASCQNTYN